MSVVEIIQHYQRSIEKCSGNLKRLLYCIEKLYRLPVTVQHLQETGVGRTVNGLRKYDGDVGDAAKALVAKWKTMVADEESSDGEGVSEDEANISEPPDDYGSQSHSTKNEKDSDDEKDSKKEASSGNHHQISKSQSRSNRTESGEVNSKHSSDDKSKSRVKHSKYHNSSSGEKHDHLKNEKIKPESSNDSKSSRDKRDSMNDSKSESKSKNKKESGDQKHDTRRDDKVRPKETEKDKEKVEDSKNKLNSRKRKIDEITDKNRAMKKNKYSESESIDENPCSPLNDDAKNTLKALTSDSESEVDHSISIKVEVTSPPRTKDSSFLSNESENDKKHVKKEHSSKSKSSHGNERKRETDKVKRQSEKLENAADHRKSEKRKDHVGNERDHVKSKNNSTASISEEKSKDKEKDKRKDKREHKKSGESKDSKDNKEARSSSTSKECKEKKKIKKEMNGDEGIDCNSGASFAEALGMCAFSSSSRKKTSNSPNLSLAKPIKIEPSTSSASSKSVGKIVTDIPIPSGSDDSPPSLLAPNVKLEPLSVDLASTLPEISPNYKPLPHINPVHRKQEEDKALSQVIYAKNQRTKVYSGNKCGYATVPTLYDMCIRILIENIEALEATGGVPYDIIKPVLKHATPDQLFFLEHHNPYLIEDTDPLWRFHCNREFRTKQREEMESWREMYMRCLDEREAKLKALTENIKQSIDKSLPVRQTKLAYVDNVVKPPRNILRKQAKYGTARSTITSTSDLKNKLISGGGGTATNISVPAPPIARSRTSAVNVTKKTKAPLMAKALQLIKGRYKR